MFVTTEYSLRLSILGFLSFCFRFVLFGLLEEFYVELNKLIDPIRCVPTHRIPEPIPQKSKAMFTLYRIRCVQTHRIPEPIPQKSKAMFTLYRIRCVQAHRIPEPIPQKSKAMFTLYRIRCVQMHRIPEPIPQKSKEIFTLYRIALQPARKPYQIRLRFTLKDGEFGVISVTEPPRRSPKWRITYQIGVHTIPDRFQCLHENLSGIV